MADSAQEQEPFLGSAPSDGADGSAPPELADELDSKSSVQLMGDVLVTALQATRDTAELTAALVREELEGFSSEVVRRLAAVAIGAVGFVLTTVGFVLGLREWFLPWSLSFLAVGVLELGIAWWIVRVQPVPSSEPAGEGIGE